MALHDTIVIGLGVAGLTAASILARAGKKVLGIEAMNRIGGRVMTVPFGDGVVELGAEWIHGTVNNSVYELSVSNNVPLVNQNILLGGFLSNGEEVNGDLINELFQFCLSTAEDIPDNHKPLGEHVTDRLTKHITNNHSQLIDTDFVTGFLDVMNLIFNNNNATNDWNDSSTHTNYEVLDGESYVSWHKIGYKTLFELLLNTYNNGPGLNSLEIKLNKEVTNIKWMTEESRNVEIICKDGERFLAKNVIVTVSLGVMKERYRKLFSPSLPIEKIEAINNIHIGVVDKVILQFQKPWWPESLIPIIFIWKGEDKLEICEEDYWTTRILGCSTPEGSKNTLTLWTSGDVGKMVETLPENVVVEKCMNLLRRFLGKKCNISEPTGMIRSAWYNNMYTRGSYSYDHVNFHQYPNAREHLAKPLLDSSGNVRVLFAGEATNTIHHSTVHGASDSGRKAAKILLQN